MSAEFDVARASFAASAPGRTMRSITRGFAAAWRSSSLIGAVRRSAAPPATTSAEWIRVAAIAILVAAALQPWLVWLMPAAVKPTAPPMIMVAIALLAAGIAWRAEAIGAAWPSSRLARLLR